MSRRQRRRLTRDVGRLRICAVLAAWTERPAAFLRGTCIAGITGSKFGKPLAASHGRRYSERVIHAFPPVRACRDVGVSQRARLGAGSIRGEIAGRIRHPRRAERTVERGAVSVGKSRRTRSHVRASVEQPRDCVRTRRQVRRSSQGLRASPRTRPEESPDSAKLRPFQRNQ